MSKEYLGIALKMQLIFDAYSHHKRYLKRMRIRVSEAFLIPFLERGAGGQIVLNINTDLSFEDIVQFVGEEFLPGELQAFYSLWADDQVERKFTQIKGTQDFFIDFA